MLSRDQVSEFVRVTKTLKEVRDSGDEGLASSDEAIAAAKKFTEMLDSDSYIFELSDFIDYIVKLSDTSIEQLEKLKDDNTSMTGSVNHLVSVISQLNPVEGLLGEDVESLQKLASYTTQSCKNNLKQPSAWIVKGTATLDRDYANWALSQGLAVVSLYSE